MPSAQEVRVVVLAGGFGTRVSHLLPGLPKPMAPCAGRPFVEWVVRFFARYGFSDFVISTGFRSEVIEAHFAAGPVAGVSVTCCREAEPLGTAGGFLNCTSGTKRPAAWLVTNGDSLVVADPLPLVESLAKAEAAIQGLHMPDASRYGTLRVSTTGRLEAFAEKQAGPGVINSGVYGFLDTTQRRFPAKRPLSFEYDVFPDLAAAGSVAVTAVDAPFIDIGTPETLAMAEKFIQNNVSAFNPASP
ncbi:sugar phosphate nucleotidyltransferase [Nibricoccus sp. IMCC34717]|uniref:sugar phosphate nucleotidyltransferase n=1 Tax=Nibricoccus sp. IMCC34717 TaxID=3034021 RepID=UPI00384CEEED